MELSKICLAAVVVIMIGWAVAMFIDWDKLDEDRYAEKAINRFFLCVVIGVLITFSLPAKFS